MKPTRSIAHTLRSLSLLALGLAVPCLVQPPVNAAVVFTQSTLNVSTGGTGAEIQTNGTLVAANHFGNGSDGMQSAVSVTLDTGLTFGRSIAHMSSGWDGHSTSNDAHDHVPLLTNANFKALMRSYIWIAWGGSISYLNIPGLTPGYTYRLQLITPDPQSCKVAVEGSTNVTWSGTVPTLMTATWTAEDTTCNAVLSRTQGLGEIDFTGYALHLVDTTPRKDITSFTLPGYKAGTISGTNISLTVPCGASVAALAPTHTVSYGATCVPPSGSTQDFTSPVQYTVTATDSSTKVYTVTVTPRPFPDPVFSLAPSTNLWDGRPMMTVTTNISNWTELLALGGTNFSYKWSVAGLAVIKTTVPGTLVLLRSQGSGPMTVTLVLDNGGWLPVTNTLALSVQEPTNDAWVVRTPGATEKPVHNQFFARDDTGLGTLYYNGTQAGTPSCVFLNLYTNSPAGDLLYTNISQTLVGGAYAFTARLVSGIVSYNAEYGYVSGSTTTTVSTVTNIVCGDAYLIDGQSNAEATGPNNTPDGVSISNYYRSPWIRSFGNYFDGSIGSGWGTAWRTRVWGPGYGAHCIGTWGMVLASNLFNKYHVPICIINGASGGTRIDLHQRGGTIYNNISNRVTAARLTHGIRAVLWHQGEQDQGAEGPDGDYDYKFYQQYFIDMSAAWKEDFPNIRFYYIFQIWPAACGDTSRNDELRDVQRTLPYLYSNMRPMTTLGIVPGSSCHYELDGYANFSVLMSPLVEQDNYGLVTNTAITAPDIVRACFTTTNRNAIALEFGQDMAWNNVSSSLIFLDRVAGKVASGSVAGKVIKLQLTGSSTNRTITYLKGLSWNGVQANLIYGSNRVAALTFCSVPIAPAPTNAPFVDITNTVFEADIATPCSIAGTNNWDVTGTMTVSNVANGNCRTFPASLSWVSAGVNLQLLTNELHVFGANALGIAATDTVVVIGLPEPLAASAVAVIGCWLFVVCTRRV